MDKRDSAPTNFNLQESIKSLLCSRGQCLSVNNLLALLFFFACQRRTSSCLQIDSSSLGILVSVYAYIHAKLLLRNPCVSVCVHTCQGCFKYSTLIVLFLFLLLLLLLLL